MNTSIRSEPPPSTSIKNKNIRKIYLDSVNQYRGSKKGGKLKTKNISHIVDNVTAEASTSSSSYLANEYNLVKRILTATKALEKLKTGTGTDTDAVNRANVTAFKFKTQEEYYGEVN